MCALLFVINTTQMPGNILKDVLSLPYPLFFLILWF